MINYYKELGVNNNASKQEIKLAYLSMLKKYHPDVYDGDPEFAQNKTALINECYATLKDDEKRKAYDIELEKFEPKPKQTTKSEDDFILKEFFKRFRTNLHKEKPKTERQTQSTPKTQRVKKQKVKKEKQISQINDEDIERKENKKLTIYIIIILAIILGIIVLCMCL